MTQPNEPKPADPQEVTQDPDLMSRPEVQQGVSESYNDADASMPEGRHPGTPPESGANFASGTTPAAAGSEPGSETVGQALYELSATGKAGEATEKAEAEMSGEQGAQGEE